jgi:hypothetical protein
VTQQADEQLNFEWWRQQLLAGKWKENSQIFKEDFYLPLYLPLWVHCYCTWMPGQYSNPEIDEQKLNYLLEHKKNHAFKHMYIEYVHV